MAHEYIPQQTQDEIYNDLIDQLFKTTEFDVEKKKFNPYSLDTKKPLNFEAKSDHGVHSSPPAYKKTKSAAVSMFEVEVLREIGDEMLPFPTTTDNGAYIKITIPGVSNDYYMKSSLINKLLRIRMYESEIRPIKNGQQFVVSFYVERGFLKENCVKAK